MISLKEMSALRGAFFISVFLIVSLAAQTEFPPVDETAKDKSFAEFKAKLIAAVEKHDVKFLESIIASDARASFGEDPGLEGFRRTYAMDDADAPFWRELRRVLGFGGAFTRGRKEFTAPYIAARWPERIDAMDYVAVIERDVPVREKAAPEAKELTRVSHCLLELDSDPDEPVPDGWIRVWLPAAKPKSAHTNGTGYVRASSTRSPLDYRAQFRREREGWKLISFLAGD